MASISAAKITEKIRKRNGSCNFKITRGMGIQTIRQKCKENKQSDVTKNGTLTPSDLRFSANQDDLNNPEFATVLDKKHTVCNTPGCNTPLTMEDINRGHLNCAKHRQERERAKEQLSDALTNVPTIPSNTNQSSQSRVTAIKLMSDQEAVDYCNNNMQHIDTVEQLARYIPDRSIILINHLHIYSNN